MSAADVRFYSLGHEECPAAEAARFGFRCPRWGRRCSGLLIAGRTELRRNGQNQNGGVAQWDFDGNPTAPTFSPSINCGGCWHGYIRAGRCVDTSGRDEPEPSPRKE